MVPKLLKSNIFFLVPYLVVVLTVLPVIVLCSKPNIHLWINQFNSPFFDWFFKYLTQLGDGIVIIIPVIAFLFFSLRHSVYCLVTYLSTGLVTQVLKRLFFEDMIRPSRYFADITPLHLVDGVKMLGGKSFPSGHATSAFALFLCLAVISGNRYLKLACFIMAALVAFSRVYLSQHFLIDVYAGSLIGSLGALSLYLVFYRYDHRWHAWKVQKLFWKDGQA
jgi:membrane-associated phospholipid phosphatase